MSLLLHHSDHVLLPRTSDVLGCAPSRMAQQQMIQLALGVSKAHRLILINPHDGELYRCLTLNFGACTSGWYWGRVAGLMVRMGHALFLGHHQSLNWQYVDDLLACLDRQSAPLLSSLLVVMFLILGILYVVGESSIVSGSGLDWLAGLCRFLDNFGPVREALPYHSSTA